MSGSIKGKHIKKVKDNGKLATGRPAFVLKPEYCEMLMVHMGQGYSYESFAADLDCCIDTMYELEKKHPEFSEAKKRGRARSMKFWEKLGIAGTRGNNKVKMDDGTIMELKAFNSGAWIFNMKNRFDWRDKQETTGSLEIALREAIVKAFPDEKELNGKVIQPKP